MKIQGHQSHPQREHWQLNHATDKVNFETSSGVVSSQDLVKLTNTIPSEGVGAFYRAQSPELRPNGWRSAVTALQSVGMSAAVGVAAGGTLSICTSLMNAATLGLVEPLSPVAAGGAGLGLGLLVGVAATAYGLVAEKREYEREGSHVYGALRSEYNQQGEKELAFYPYATGAQRVNVTDYAQTQSDQQQGSPWWLEACRNRI